MSNSSENPLMQGKPIVFPNGTPPADRQIKPGWIAEAVEGGLPIILEGAQILAPLVLVGLSVPGPFVIRDSACRLIDLSYCTFGQTVQLTGCRFEGKLLIRSARFERDLILRASIFEEEVSLIDATIRQSLIAERATFADGIQAQRVVVERLTSLQDGQIEGFAAFFGSRFDGDVDFDRANFSTDASFERVRVSGNFYARACHFGGAARFGGAEIFGQGAFQSAKFDGPAVFDHIHFGGNAYFHKAEFHKETMFGAARLDGQAVFRDAAFDGKAIFDRLQVSGELFFDEARFKSEVSFLGTDVGWQAGFHDTIFEGAAMFHAFHTGGNAYFVRSDFRGWVEFLYARIDGQALFHGVRFASDVSFDGLRVASDFSFAAPGVQQGELKPAFFGGRARFLGIQVGGVAVFRAVQFDGPVDFDGSRFGESLTFRKALFGDDLLTRGVSVERGVDFVDATLGKKWDCRRARFAVLQMDNELSTFPHSGAGERYRADLKVDLRGCSYDQLTAYWRPLLDRQSPFDRQPYAQLERVLRTMAKEDLADDVYYRARIVERNTISWSNPRRKLWSYFLSAVSGYGVRPMRMVAWITLLPLFAAIGFWFSPGALLPQGYSSQFCIDFDPPFAVALLISLQSFLPFDLPTSSRWLVSDCSIVIGPQAGASVALISASSVAALLRILGWIFIPLAVATFAGFVRYVGGSRS